MATKAGDIYYDIELETAQLIEGQREVSERLERIERDMKRSAQSATTLDTSMSKLASTIKAVIAASALREMASMVQKYQEMSERVQMATSSQEEFEHVQQRLLKTANGTYRSLSEAQELYITTAASLRSLGYTTDQAVDVQDSMSYAFVKNATSADRASAAISAFSKSINTGKVAADQWETITTAIPSVIEDIATASSKSAAEIRALGAAGKLTASQLSEGLRQSLEANSTAAAGMSNNLTDAGVRMKTAITSALVEMEKETGALQAFTNGVIAAADALLSFSGDTENMPKVIDAITIAVTALSAVMGARLVGAFSAATAAKLNSVSASRAQQLADIESAQAAEASANAIRRKALADKDAAASALALAQAEYQVARGSAAEMLAVDALNAAKSRSISASAAAAQAEMAHAAAATRTAAAVRAASITINFAKNAFALIGGPAGAAMLAGAAVFYFYQKAQQARQEAIAFADGLDKLNESMKSMSNTALRGAIADSNVAMRGMKDAAADLESQIRSLTTERDGYVEKGKQFGTTAEQGNGLLQRAARLTDEIAQKQRDLASLQEKLTRTTKTHNDAQTQINNNMLTAMGVHDGLIEKGTTLERVQGAVAKAFGNTANEINRANLAGQNFNPKSLQIEAPTAEGDKVILNLQEQNELLKIQDERLRAVTKAGMEAAKVTDNKNQIDNAKRLAGENFDLAKAEEARKKAQRESDSESKRSASSAASVALKLENMKQQTELATSATENLSREQTILKAQQSLGQAATVEDIRLAGEYAAAQWDAAKAKQAMSLIPVYGENQQYQSDLQALETSLRTKKISQAEYNTTVERLEAEHQTKLAKIRADAVVTPQQEAKATVDPVQALANENAKKLALIQQFEATKTLTQNEAEALRNATTTEYEQQRIAAQWAIYRNQSTANELLATSVESMQSGATNAITGLLNGTQSLSEAFANIGTSILNGVVGSLVQMGTQWVMSAMMGQAAQTGAIAANQMAATAALTASTAAGVAAASTLLASWSPAAMAASIATSGGAATAGLAGYTTAMTTAQTMSIAGARYNGGPVAADSLYQVGESGKPEIFKASNGSQYMIPGDNGSVISNRDLSGSSGGAAVTQTNHFTINTTGGIDDATLSKLATMMKQVSLSTIKNEQRPHGMLERSR